MQDNREALPDVWPRCTRRAQQDCFLRCFFHAKCIFGAQVRQEHVLQEPFNVNDPF